MKVLLTGALLAAALSGWAQQSVAPWNQPVIRAHSRSGQFQVIADPESIPKPAADSAAARVGWMHLTPSTVAVNCERVRDAVLGLLALPDRWQGRVTVVLLPPRRNGVPRVIFPSRQENGWVYRVEMPSEMSPEHLVETLARTVLIEIANRSSPDRCAELPRWLVEGVAAEIHHSKAHLVVQANRTQFYEVVALDPVSHVRARLASEPALTFDELSWPGAEFDSGDRREDYRDSAQLLVHMLTARLEGRERLGRFVSGLGANLNWQIPFLDAHEGTFDRLIDVEKWWAVAVANVTGRNQWQMWGTAEALSRLDRALRVDVQVSTAAGEVPSLETWSLQRVVAQLDLNAQETALAQVLQAVVQVRPHSPPEVAQVADAYRDAVQAYLERRRGSPIAITRGGIAPSARVLGEGLVRQLNELDAVRRDLPGRLVDLRR